MRTIKFFFISILAFLLSLILVILLGREILLLSATTAIKADFETISKKIYSNLCFEEFGESQEYWTQLRFLSDKEYNLELVCKHFDQQPVLIESRRLPIFVRKSSNTSGLVLNDDNYPSYIELFSLARKINLYVEDQQFYSSYLAKPDLDYISGPISQCQAISYHCCAETQTGLGTAFTQVTDCPKSCYESCLQRPVVLSFNSRPPVDENRNLSVKSGQDLQFSYVIGDSQDDLFEGQIAKEDKLDLIDQIQVLFDKDRDKITDQAEAPIIVKIDFGDGQFYESQNLQDSSSHVYTCKSNLCYYEAELLAIDKKGVASIGNDLSKIIIKVSNF